MVDDHFMRLFSTEGSRQWGDILEYVDPIVTPDMNDGLRNCGGDGDLRGFGADGRSKGAWP